MSFNNISAVEHASNQEYTHRVNVVKGWFDKPVTFLEAMALLATEVVEVNDAHKEEGLLAGWQAQEQMTSEFADCYIRLLDDCSRFGIDLGLDVELYRHSYEYHRTYLLFDGVCMQLMRRIRDITEAYRTHGLETFSGTPERYSSGPEIRKTVAHFYLQLQDACDQLNVDLVKAFAAKMAVNETRPYRHGNKVA